MGQRCRRKDPLQSMRSERQLAQKGRAGHHGKNCRTNIVDKARQRQLRRAHASAGSICRFQHHHAPARLRQTDRRRQPVRSRAHHDGIGLWQIEPGKINFVWLCWHGVQNKSSPLGSHGSWLISALTTNAQTLNTKNQVLNTCFLSLHPELARDGFSLPRGLHHHRASGQHFFCQRYREFDRARVVGNAPGQFQSV